LRRVAAGTAARERATALDAQFIALADPTRRRVLEALGSGERRAGELAAAVAMSPPALSRHLRALRRAGLVVERGLDDDARVRLYRLQSGAFAALRGWLDDVESFWNGQLQAFKAHAEARPPVRGRRS
jgi:DNA-binding transcriptional ArsR family regulator